MQQLKTRASLIRGYLGPMKIRSPAVYMVRKERVIIMSIANKAVFVTGANRGIGQALVEEALRRGARRVYAGTRQPLVHPDARVTPVILDVTNEAQVAE